MEDAFSDEFVDVRAGLERGVQLDKRLGPQEAGAKILLDALPNAIVPDRDEAVRVGRVVRPAVPAGALVRRGERGQLTENVGQPLEIATSGGERPVLNRPGFLGGSNP